MNSSTTDSLSATDLGGPLLNTIDGELFGRQDEIHQIDEILHRHTKSTNNDNKKRIIALNGVAGSGKSALIRSYPWKEKGWYWTSGKFESHHRRAEPYSAIVEAMDEFVVNQWLREHAATTNKDSRLKEFQNLLERDAGVLKKILPNIFLAVADDTADAGNVRNDQLTTKTAAKVLRETKNNEEDENSDSEDDNTSIASGSSSSSSSDLNISAFSNSDAVHAAFCRLFSFLCTTSKPLLLFLDDIQWADKASLDVLQALVSLETIPGLLIAVSYRAEEVNHENENDNKHMVAAFLESIQTAGVEVHSIPINNLDVTQLNSLVACMLRNDPIETLPLAEVIHNKTAGNPFFILQFLRYLRDEKFLSFDYVSFKCQWGNIDKLQDIARISDNVADVVAATMQRLPQTTQMALKVASCLGKIVPMDVLQEYFHCRFTAIESLGHSYIHALQQLQKDGLQGVFTSAVESGILLTQQSSRPVTYTWSHDKLQHIAYASIPEENRASLHFHLGKLLWKMSEKDTSKEGMIFAAAGQLNRYSDLKKGDQRLGVDVARLNLRAAKLMMDKAALVPAMQMLQAGERNLDGENRWKENYRLCLQIYSNLADIGVKLGHFDVAMEAVDEVEKNAKRVEDKFQAHCASLTKMTSGHSRDYDKGVRETLEILKLYGEKLPNKLLPGQVFIETQRLKSRLPGGRIEGLLGLPVMMDSRSLKIAKLLTHFLSDYSVYSQNYKHLRPLISIRILNMACKKGICDATAYGVMGLAITLQNEGHYQEALEYGQLAIRIIDKFPVALGSSHCVVKVATHAAIFSVLLPLNKSLDGMLECRRLGFRTGDTERAIYAVIGYGWSYFCAGLPLGPFQDDYISYCEEAKTFQSPYTVQLLFKVFRQTALNLQQESENPTILTGDAMNQEEELGKVDGAGRKTTLRDIYTFRLMLACIYGKWDVAEALIDALEPYLSTDFFVLRRHFRSVYLGLAAHAVARVSCKRKYRALGKKITKIFKAEVQNGAVNSYPILKMLEAEETPSKEAFETATKTCARLGLVHHEAYMCERAGFYFLREGDADWARIYLERALLLYNDWGAAGKVNALSAKFQGRLGSVSAPMSHNTALKGRQRFDQSEVEVLRGSELPCAGPNPGAIV